MLSKILFLGIMIKLNIQASVCHETKMYDVHDTPLNYKPNPFVKVFKILISDSNKKALKKQDIFI